MFEPDVYNTTAKLTLFDSFQESSKNNQTLSQLFPDMFKIFDARKTAQTTMKHTNHIQRLRLFENPQSRSLFFLCRFRFC